MKARRSRVAVVLSVTLALLTALGPLTALAPLTAEYGPVGT
jgi:hypothetical protein